MYSMVPVYNLAKKDEVIYYEVSEAKGLYRIRKEEKVMELYKDPVGGKLEKIEVEVIMVMYKVQVPREVKVAEACTQVEIFPDVPDKKEVEVFMKINL